MPMCTTCKHLVDLTNSVCSECQTPVDPSIHAYLLAVLDARKCLAQQGSDLHRSILLARTPREAARLRTEIARVGEAIDDLRPPPGYESAHASFRHATRLLQETFDSLVNVTARQSTTNASNLQHQLTHTMAQVKRSIMLLQHGPTTVATSGYPENDQFDQPSSHAETTGEYARENQLAVATQPVKLLTRWEDSVNTLLEAMREATEQIAQSAGNRQVRLFQKMASDIIGLREENSALFDELNQLRRDIAMARQELADVRLRSLNNKLDRRASTDFDGWSTDGDRTPREPAAADISEWPSTSALLKRGEE